MTEAEETIDHLVEAGVISNGTATKLRGALKIAGLIDENRRRWFIAISAFLLVPVAAGLSRTAYEYEFWGASLGLGLGAGVVLLGAIFASVAAFDGASRADKARDHQELLDRIRAESEIKIKAREKGVYL